jgi:hypothetical protein
MVFLRSYRVCTLYSATLLVGAPIEHLPDGVYTSQPLIGAFTELILLGAPTEQLPAELHDVGTSNNVHCFISQLRSDERGAPQLLYLPNRLQLPTTQSA